MPEPRKRTRFQTCERHAWLMAERRERRAEFFVEGGPAHDPGDGGCRGGVCRLWPGRDLFVEDICHGEFELDWTASDARTYPVAYTADEIGNVMSALETWLERIENGDFGPRAAMRDEEASVRAAIAKTDAAARAVMEPVS